MNADQQTILLPLPPVGVKFFTDGLPEDLNAPTLEVLSFCDAAQQVLKNGPGLVQPGSMSICKWAPVILGFKEPETQFEKGLLPRMSPPVAAVYLARMDQFPKGITPDSVILRGPLEVLTPLFEKIGREHTALEMMDDGKIARSALRLLEDQNANTVLNRTVGRVLGSLQRYSSWRSFTTILFRSDLITRGFDQLIKRTMADMSMCRNSTVIPHLTGKANLSFYCTGGIAWGMNNPDYLTSGWPPDLYQQVEPLLDWEA